MSHDPYPRHVADDPDVVRLRAQARLHDGVVPVPFLGTTWQRRGAPYWRRRVGATLLVLVLTLVVGAIAASFTAGIIGGIGHQPAGIIVGTVYALVAIPGFVDGRRRVAKAPIDNRGRAPRTAVPFGCLALILAPFSFGLALAVLQSMFGRDFTGERRARKITAGIRPV